MALACMLLIATPLSALAQASGNASAKPAGAPQASVVGGTTGAPAASAGGAQAKPEASAPQAASASASPSEPAVRAVATPVGGNATKETPEPLPYFAYLLIILGGIWFLAAIAGIVRLMTRPPSPAMAAAIPDAERDRPFLSFIMPFGALITVAIIVTIWGVLFLATSHLSELYPLAIDLFVVCLVMLVATFAALRSGGRPQPEVH